MADTTKDWIKVRDRIDEDADVIAAAENFYCEFFTTKMENETLSYATTLVIGCLVRLWCRAKLRAVRVPDTDDAHLRVSVLSLDDMLGQFEACKQLERAGLLIIQEDNTVVFPNLCRWVTLWSEIRESKSAAGRVGGKHKPSTSEAQAKHKPSASETESKPDSRLQTPNTRQHTSNASARAQPDDRGFAEWWDSYPRRPGAAKGNKGLALTEWAKLGEPERADVVMATAALIASDSLPKDAERFLRPPRGKGDPEYAKWLEPITGPEAGNGSAKPTSTDKIRAAMDRMIAEEEANNGPA